MVEIVDLDVDRDRDRDDTVRVAADREATIDAESFDVMWIRGGRRPRSTSRFHVAVAVAAHAHDLAHVEDL